MKYKWTVLFLVHASDSHTGKYADQLFRILKATDHNDQVKVLVLYGGLQSSNQESYKIQVVLYEIKKVGAYGKQVMQEVKPYGVIDMGDDRELGPIFADVKKEYSSDRLLLFTWDHGSGFGIFKGNPKENVKQYNTRDIYSYEQELDAAELLIRFHSGQDNNVQTKSIRSISDDNFSLQVITSKPVEEVYTKGIKGLRDWEEKKIKTSMLTNDELSNVIRGHSEDSKVDLLIMMNCMMQMIETGYALREAVDYLIAPETCIFWAGYDYISIINKLCAEPGIETEGIARHAMDTIETFYQSTPFKDAIADLVVALVKPGKSPLVKEAIDGIADKLRNELSHHQAQIEITRQECEDLSSKFVTGVPYHFVDFVNYAFRLGNKLPDLESACRQLKEATNSYVTHMSKGKNYTRISEDAIGDVNGFTIYFPPEAEQAYKDFYYEWFYKEGKYQTSFADKSTWKNFLMKYFRLERKGMNEVR